MSTNIVDISSKLVTMLGTISKLNGVYEYTPASPSDGAYPFAVIRFDAGDGEFGDNRRNVRTYTFIVTLFVERTSAGFGNEKSERIFREILDQIITMFDNNTTLDGMVQKVDPVAMATVFEDTDIGDTRRVDITLNCMKVVDSLN